MNYICYAENESQYEKLRIITCDSPLEIRLLSSYQNDNDVLKAHTIFLLSNGCIYLPIRNPNDSTVIISYDNVTSAYKLKDSRLPLITYGMSDKATISCSSITEDCLLISLQRSIKALNGTSLEPQELVVNRHCEQSDNEIMMIEAAIKLLLSE